MTHARRTTRLSVRGRLVALATVIGAGTLACLLVGALGLAGARSKSNSSQHTFNVFRAERDAYEGWLTDDDQSNMVAALAALQEHSQLPLMRTTAAQVVQGHQQAVSSLSELVKLAPTGQIRQQAERLQSDVATYNGFTTQVLSASLAFQAQRAVQLATVSNVNISNQTQADFDTLGAVITKRAAAITASAGSTTRNATDELLIIAAICLLLTIAFTILIIRSITRPLGEVTAAAEQIATGDVEVELHAQGSDEIGRMAAAFNSSVEYLQRMAGAAREMADGNFATEVTPQGERDALGHAFAEMRSRIAGMLGEIASSSDSIGAASEQMARSGEQAGAAVTEIAGAVSAVASGAESQVRDLGQARSLTSEVTSSSASSAADARQTQDVVSRTRELAQQGTEAVTRATEAMEAVQSSSAEISASIRELGATSEQIGTIAETITSIAEQTNLLALNAAIEAARAGDQGRGFAVVAEEVRKLAEESQSAAGSIGALIKQIQSGTSRAVAAVDDGASRAETGVSTVDQAREVFSRIHSGVEDMADQVERIVAAVEQVAAAGGRVQDSIEQVLAVAEQSSASAQQVSATTQETSASTQQIAASAADLSKTADELRALVRRFVLPS